MKDEIKASTPWPVPPTPMEQERKAMFGAGQLLFIVTMLVLLSVVCLLVVATWTDGSRTNALRETALILAIVSGIGMASSVALMYGGSRR